MLFEKDFLCLEAWILFDEAALREIKHLLFEKPILLG